MKSLKAIQVLSKIGMILSKIVFICCCVGFGCCIISVPFLAGSAEILNFGDFTLHGLIEKEAGMSLGSMCSAIVIGAIACACEAVLAKFAEVYFKRELRAGTPFTLGGAKELLRLGILALAIPAGYSVIATVWQTIAVRIFENVEKVSTGSLGSFSFGVMFIIGSLLCRYGAELAEKKPMPEVVNTLSEND